MKNYSWIENYNVGDPEDVNDPARACDAIPLDFPPEFSAKAKEVLKYLDDTAFLFYYKNKYIVTDESLELTAGGDGKTKAFCFPRWTGDSFEDLETWLELTWKDLKDDEEI